MVIEAGAMLGSVEVIGLVSNSQLLVWVGCVRGMYLGTKDNRGIGLNTTRFNVHRLSNIGAGLFECEATFDQAPVIDPRVGVGGIMLGRGLGKEYCGDGIGAHSW